MSAVVIPKPLRELLVGSEFESATLGLADAVGTVLGDNEMPFFPAFTDHGSNHVEQVLEAAVELIPSEVWDQELLHPADGAVLISAALLHDLAMHVRDRGFVELVRQGTPYEPQLWFGEAQPARNPDLPWPRLWDEFQWEARHFGTSQLELLLGADSGGRLAVPYQDALDPLEWTVGDRLLIGEFLRRHHARLAHEIARYGMPGADPAEFPVLSESVPKLARAIGAVARSHGENLRTMVDYAGFLEPGSKRPEGTLLVYLMAVLRVADYLQIDSDRAPSLLLRLKRPQSPLSIEEWNTHGAISAVVWDHDDPHAISVTVAPSHRLRTHLALADLFEDMQREMDTATAVVDEVFGGGDLSALGLSRRRVVTNLDQPSLRRQLDYVPRRAALRSDPDLFRLVIHDLYGHQPAVAGRELVQNAVDAVRLRREHEAAHGIETPGEEFRALDADVEVCLEEIDEESCLLRVSDRGIGMTPEVVIDFFLQAGASLSPSALPTRSGGRGEAPLKAGRFGVGAFAAFLLGPEMRVKTRHVDEQIGIVFSPCIDEDLIELEWADLPVGTEVEIPFESRLLPVQRGLLGTRLQSPDELFADIAGFYRLADPSVTFIHRRQSEEPTDETLSAPADVPSNIDALPCRWRHAEGTGMDAVIWRVPYGPALGGDTRLVHNGILIKDLSGQLMGNEVAFQWSDERLDEELLKPSVAVFDRQHLLRLKLHRYGLVDRTLPFEDQLLESIGADIVAHAISAGMESHPLQPRGWISPVLSRTTWMPSLRSLLADEMSGPLLVLWQDRRHVPRRRLASIDSRSFQAPDGGLSWEEYPFRACVGLEEHGAYSGSGEDWPGVLRSVREATIYWASRLAQGRVLSVVVRGRDEHSFGRGGGPPAPEESTDELLDVAHQIQGEGRADWIALSLFVHGLVAPAAGHERLAAPWRRLVGTGLPRARAEQEEVVERVLEEAPALRPLVRAWQLIEHEADGNPALS